MTHRHPETVAAAAAVRAFYAAVGRGDIGGVLAVLAPDLEWTEAERFPYYAGTWRTPQEVVDKAFARFATEWDGFAATASQLVAEGDTVAAFGVYTGRFKATGRDLSAPFAHRWVVRDGRIVAFTMYTDTAKVLEVVTA